MLRPLWLLLFSAQLTAASVNAADLHLSLSAAKVQYRAGEAVVVRVLVNNPLESDRIWYLKRSFWPVPYSTPMDGDLGLILHVFAPSGRYLSPTRPSMTLVRMKTEQSQFKRLFPG
jgi:hypothetical protein